MYLKSIKNALNTGGISNKCDHDQPAMGNLHNFYKTCLSIYKLLSFKYLEDLRREGGRRMKAKRIRTIFTPEQLERMEDEFNK